MTMRARFSSRSATAAVLVAAGVSALAVGAQSATGRSVTAHVQARVHTAMGGGCHITQPRSIASSTRVKVVFVNHDPGTVGVYWLNYTGFLVYYESIAPHASFTQSTFRSNAWVMLNGSFNCVGYVVTSGAPRYVIR